MKKVKNDFSERRKNVQNGNYEKQTFLKSEQVLERNFFITI